MSDARHKITTKPGGLACFLVFIFSDLRQAQVDYEANTTRLLRDERWGAGVEYHFQEFNEPYVPS